MSRATGTGDRQDQGLLDRIASMSGTVAINISIVTAATQDRAAGQSLKESLTK